MGRITPPEGAIRAYAVSGEVDVFTGGMRVIESGLYYSLNAWDTHDSSYAAAQSGTSTFCCKLRHGVARRHLEWR